MPSNTGYEREMTVANVGDMRSQRERVDHKVKIVDTSARTKAIIRPLFEYLSVKGHRIQILGPFHFLSSTRSFINFCPNNLLNNKNHEIIKKV